MLEDAILGLRVMPSMRGVMTAGAALRRDEAAIYNCAYLPMDNLKSFDEEIYTLMLGTGVGFSVEHVHTSELPVIAEDFHDSATTIIFEDSRIGWAKGFKEYVSLLVNGQVPRIDLSKIRPAGARLKTFGGRASGPKPLEDLLQFTEAMFKRAAGRRLTTLEAHDLACKIADIVVVGGVRRSALISLSDIGDDRMRKAKSGEWWKQTPHRRLANNSAVYEEKPDIGLFMKEWLSLYESKSGERGIFSREAVYNVIDNANEFRAAHFGDKARSRDKEHVFGCNPCFTGDTLVAVADGRGYLSFAELANEKKDIPVYCLDQDGVVRSMMMRNPRITGKNQAIYKITLDDGNVIRATANHKFYLRDGSEKRVDELVAGDSLKTMTRYKTKLWSNKNSADYWFVRSMGNTRAEHRVFAEHSHNTDLLGNSDKITVHHKDYDSLNNKLSNLEVMTVQEHDTLHREQMLGDNNPMRRMSDEQKLAHALKISKIVSEDMNPRYSGFSNEELKEHAKILTRLLCRQATQRDWTEYASKHSLPISFSKWRMTHLGGIKGFLQNAALEEGYIVYDADARVIRKLHHYLNNGYDCYIKDGIILFNKVCEISGEEFITNRPEVSVKSEYVKEHFSMMRKINANIPEIKERRETNQANAFRKKKIETREAQARAYNDLRFELNRDPLKKEWTNKCLASEVSSEISRVSSPFRSYEDLKTYASTANHKVISVEFDCYEDVYNGTVDEYHNYFVGSFKNGEKIVSVNVANCSEIILRPYEFCNLTSVQIREDDDLQTLLEKVRVATIIGTIQSTFTHFKYINKKWQRNCEDERLLGVSLNGIYGNALTNGSLGQDKLVEALQEMKKVAIQTNIEWADKLGINSSVAITCVKPEGTVSALNLTPSGIHPDFAPFYIRYVQNDVKDPLTQFMAAQGVPWEPYGMDLNNMVVFKFPIKSSESSKFAKDVGAIEHLELWKTYQMHFCEHKPSVTISVRESEWLEVGAWVYDNFEWMSGVSFLPYDDHIYVQAPFTRCTKEEYDELLKEMPKNIDWDKLAEFESEDSTTNMQTLACSGPEGCFI